MPDDTAAKPPPSGHAPSTATPGSGTGSGMDDKGNTGHKNEDGGGGGGGGAGGGGGSDISVRSVAGEDGAAAPYTFSYGGTGAGGGTANGQALEEGLVFGQGQDAPTAATTYEGTPEASPPDDWTGDTALAGFGPLNAAIGGTDLL